MPEKLKTMTAPRAVIENGKGEKIGLVRNIRISESYQRANVQGLGTIYPSERPIMSFSGTWSCDQYLIDLKKSGVPGLENRDVSDTEIFQATKVLLEEPMDIVILKKEAKVIDENGNVTEVKPDTIARIRDIYLDSMNFDITEGAVSGLSQSGVFTKSVLTS